MILEIQARMPILIANKPVKFLVWPTNLLNKRRISRPDSWLFKINLSYINYINGH